MAAKDDIGKYAIVPEWVLTCVSPDALQLYCYLRINAWGDSGYALGRQRMMDDLGLSRTGLTRVLTELQKFKAITVKHNFGVGGQGWNTYTVNTVRPLQRRAKKAGGVSTGGHGGDHQRDGGVSKGGHPYIDETTKMKGHTSPKAPSGGKRAECSVCGELGVVGNGMSRVTLHQPRAGRRTHYVHDTCDPAAIVRTGSLSPRFRDQDGDEPYRLK